MHARPRSDRALCSHVRARPDFVETLERTRAHLRHATRVLRARTSSRRTEAERNARERHLDRIEAYALRGVLPRNHVAPESVPCFVDDGGRPCAVAHILVEDGETALTARVVRDANYAYLATMRIEGLAEWVASSGLTAEELAWIQPTYSPDPCDVTCLVCAEPAKSAYTFDGRVLEPAPDVAVPEAALWAGSAGDRWTAGARLRKAVAGKPTLSTALPNEAGATDWYSAWGVGETTWFAGAGGAIRRQGDDVFFVVPYAPPTSPYERRVLLWAVSGASAQDVWLSSLAGALHWDGAKLERADVCASSPRCMAHIAALDGGRAFFGGASIVDRQGTTCTGYSLENLRVTAIAAASPTNVIAVVETDDMMFSHRHPLSGVLHWNGTEWLSLDVPKVEALSTIGGGRFRFVTPSACARYAPDDACLAARAEACATARRAHVPSGVEVRIAPPKRAAKYACPLVAAESTSMQLAPLQADAVDPVEPAAVSVPESSSRRGIFGLAALGLAGVGIGGGAFAGLALRRRRTGSD